MMILDPLADPRWDEKLLDHDGATVFHSSAWARVLVDSYGFRCCYLAEGDGDRFTFLLPMMDVRSLLTGKRGVSLPFTDFCEPLLGPGSAAPDALGALRELGQRRRWRYCELRGGTEILGEAAPAAVVLAHALDLTLSEQALLAGVRDSTRRNIAKARRAGVTVRIGVSEQMLEEFFRLNCLARREHGLPPQPRSFFRNLQTHLLAQGQGHVVLASVGERAAAGAVYLHFGRQALFKYGASDKRLQALRPSDVVMWEAIRWYREHGFQRLCLGRTEADHEGLRRYKLGWGVTEQVRNYYRYDFGRAAFGRANVGAGAAVSALFRRLPLGVSRAIGSALYRHVA